ncbi:hypothetical protein ACGFNX_20080 [Streptomyces sp. NPDC048723]|uniref:hypothetical protein n=1 Tax=Streptomyces sp. NPDC048723 TaxID=3365589 RepID=UPI003722B8F4
MTFSTTTKSFRLGIRPGPMAMEQTGRFARALRLQYPDLDLEVLEITSEGDQHRGPLVEIDRRCVASRHAAAEGAKWITSGGCSGSVLVGRAPPTGR